MLLMESSHRLYALCAFVFLILAMCLWPTSTPTTEEVPWKESGYPVLQKEIWRIRVCHIHHRLFLQNPESKPRPIHAILGLDATESPFQPLEHSSDPSGCLYEAVHKEIIAAFHSKANPIMQGMLRDKDGNFEAENQRGSIGEDHEWLNILMTVTSILSHDLIRAEYTKHFVPSLVPQGLSERWKEDHTISKERLRRLEHLCA